MAGAAASSSSLSEKLVASLAAMLLPGAQARGTTLRSLLASRLREVAHELEASGTSAAASVAEAAQSEGSKLSSTTADGSTHSHLTCADPWPAQAVGPPPPTPLPRRRRQQQPQPRPAAARRRLRLRGTSAGRRNGSSICPGSLRGRLRLRFSTLGGSMPGSRRRGAAGTTAALGLHTLSQREQHLCNGLLN